MPKGLEIIYEDENCLVINKPAGLAVQGGKGVSVSLDNILSQMYSPRPLLVHRLDRDTSGVILVAKNTRAAAGFSALLGRERAAGKQYLAVCAGQPAQNTGVISSDIEIHGKVKKAETRYKVLHTVNSGEARTTAARSVPSGKLSLVELELGTGRMHQIRRHLASSGSPVLGDDKYGDFALNKFFRKTFAVKHLLLHARTLRIPAAPGINAFTAQAPLPAYFQDFLEKCGLGCVLPQFRVV